MFRRYCVSLLVLHGLLSIHASYGHPIINQIMRLSLDGQTGAVTRSQNFENRLASTKRINQNQETLLLLLELLETMNTQVEQHEHHLYRTGVDVVILHLPNIMVLLQKYEGMQENNLSGSLENSEIIPSQPQAFVRIVKKSQSLSGAIQLSDGKNQV